MADREKTIKGLKCLAGMNDMKNNPCLDCNYQECQTYAICIEEIATDALSLLKAQEPKTVKEMLVVGGHLMGKCPRCCKILSVQDHPIACGFCGQVVKWE